MLSLYFLCVIAYKTQDITVRHNAQVFFGNGPFLSNPAKKISDALRKLRRHKGWSLDVTSKKTGVSKAMLGQIERGESSPTIATLWKIASGFNTSFSSFIEDIETIEPSILHRATQLSQVHPQDDKIRISPLFPYDQTLKFEVFVIELFPGCTHLSAPHQRGVSEHVIVSQGAIEVLIQDTWHKVPQNGGLRFEAHQPHGYRNTTSTPAIFHDIIHYTGNAD